MTANELIEKFLSLDPDTQVYVRFLNSDADGSCWIDYADFDEGDVKISGKVVYIDISNK